MDYPTIMDMWSTLANVAMGGAAVAGAVAAWVGLTTWKTQIRWQQSRGVAVGLLRSFGSVKDHMLRFNEFSRPNFENTRGSELNQSIYEQKIEVADRYFNQLRERIEDFRSHTSEAKIVWNEDMSSFVVSLKDFEHTLKGAIFCSAQAINPRSTVFQRNQNSGTAEEFWSEIYGIDGNTENLGARLAAVQKQLEEKITQRNLV